MPVQFSLFQSFPLGFQVNLALAISPPDALVERYFSSIAEDVLTMLFSELVVELGKNAPETALARTPGKIPFLAGLCPKRRWCKAQSSELHFLTNERSVTRTVSAFCFYGFQRCQMSHLNKPPLIV